MPPKAALLPDIDHINVNPASFMPGLHKFPPRATYTGVLGNGALYTWPLAVPSAFMARCLGFGALSSLLVLSNPQHSSNYAVVFTLTAVLCYFDGYEGTPVNRLVMIDKAGFGMSDCLLSLLQWTELADAYWDSNSGAEKLSVPLYRVLAGIGFFGGSMCEACCAHPDARCGRGSSTLPDRLHLQVMCLTRYIQSPCTVLCIACMASLAPKAKKRQRCMCGLAVVAFVALAVQSKANLYDLGLLVALGCCVGLEAHAIMALRKKLGTQEAHNMCRLPRVAVSAAGSVAWFTVAGVPSLRPTGWSLLWCGSHVIVHGLKTNWEHSFLDLCDGPCLPPGAKTVAMQGFAWLLIGLPAVGLPFQIVAQPVGGVSQASPMLVGEKLGWSHATVWGLFSVVTLKVLCDCNASEAMRAPKLKSPSMLPTHSVWMLWQGSQPLLEARAQRDGGAIVGSPMLFLYAVIDSSRIYVAFVIYRALVPWVLAPVCNFIAPDYLGFYCHDYPVPRLKGIDLGVAYRVLPRDAKDADKPGLVSLNIGHMVDCEQGMVSRPASGEMQLIKMKTARMLAQLVETQASYSEQP